MSAQRTQWVVGLNCISSKNLAGFFISLAEIIRSKIAKFVPKLRSAGQSVSFPLEIQVS